MTTIYHALNVAWLGKSGDPPHPALWHMMDVAAVAVEVHRPLYPDPAIGDAVAVLTAVNCHHGTFQNAAPWFDPDAIAIGSKAMTDVPKIFDLFRTLFPNAGFHCIADEPTVRQQTVRRLAWQMSGLVVQADWIGSNPEWFPPAAPDITPQDYWTRAQDQARHAVKHAGLFRATVRTAPARSMLGALRLRPMQQAVADIAISDDPTLFMIEDMTGSGKTEAALILAKRLLQAGHGRGVLFADVAVGTIDQALMSVLPTRFNTLRQWALADKVLIIDEAHSYDPYMEAELTALLRFHRYFGGSAIVMTATLPTPMMRRYASVYGEVPDVVTTAYPKLTAVNFSPTSVPVAPVPENVRRVAVHRIGSSQEAIDQIVALSETGASVAWVRNAVDDAIDAVAQLAEQGIEADLLHARFTIGDRLTKEQALQARFGKGSGDRAGRVVVATQVIEQSLDLDFDALVSDLAPIGALIQRAGRLWRHRDRTGWLCCKLLPKTKNCFDWTHLCCEVLFKHGDSLGHSTWTNTEGTFDHSFFHLGGVLLHPAINSTVINMNATLRHHGFQIAITDPIATIPTNSPKNDFSCKIPALKVTHEHALSYQFIQK